jgi:hypothetical protein
MLGSCIYRATMKFMLLGDSIAHNIDEVFLRKAISPHTIEIPGSDICFA